MGKYSRPKGETVSKFNEDGNAKPILADGEDAIPVYVQSDGKVYARGFVDTNDNLELFVKNEKVYARFIKDDRYGLDESILDVSTGSLTYNSVKPVKYTYYGNFGSYAYPARSWDITALKKFELQHPETRSKIRAIKGAGGAVTFSGQKTYTGNNGVSSDVWSRTNKSQRWFKPYKVPVMLRPESLINMYDLIILKTGEYSASGMAKEEICWVSTHEVVKENMWVVNREYYANSGLLRNSAGVVTGTGIFGYKGAQGYMSKGRYTGVAYLSSKNYYYDNDELISGGMEWFRQERDSNNFKTGVVTTSYDYTNLANTDFYKFYADQQSKISTGHFQGTIPANTPFKMECWHTNARYAGFDGRITVLPFIPELTGINSTGFIIEAEVEGFGKSDVGYEESATLALLDAERKKLNAIDKKLVELGYAHKGRRWNKFVKLIDTDSKIGTLNETLKMNVTGTGTQ